MMNDIVERLQAKKRNATNEEDDALDEILLLRQRVQELEEDAETVAEKLSKECAASLRLMKELAELKQSQGEPVAYLHKWKPHANTIGKSLHFVGVSPHGDDVEITPLCLCSTPTIPEGWQIVPIEPTDKMREFICDCYFDGQIDTYKSMLAAAPKPDDA